MGRRGGGRFGTASMRPRDVLAGAGASKVVRRGSGSGLASEAVTAARGRVVGELDDLGGPVRLVLERDGDTVTLVAVHEQTGTRFTLATADRVAPSAAPSAASKLEQVEREDGA